MDRLLASRPYAEEQARHWLDAVRYADTAGFHGDNRYPTWPYRDYVLRAVRNNKPFDEFTREQLAGDLIPNATIDQKVASALQSPDPRFGGRMKSSVLYLPPVPLGRKRF